MGWIWFLEQLYTNLVREFNILFLSMSSTDLVPSMDRPGRLSERKAAVAACSS